MVTKMRTYEKTHPWLKFTLDLRKCDYEFWMALGEARSKCEHIAGTPLMPKIANKIFQVYLAKGSLATTAIEGNTLTEKEVMDRLEDKLELPPSKKYLGKEIDNVVKACNYIGNKLFNEGLVELCVDDIKKYNNMILEDLRLEEGVIPGKIRTYSVGVGRYRAAPPEDCEYLLEKLCNWINKDFIPPNEDHRMAFGILKAIITHLYIAWIHPFGDGNGRTARMIEFQILILSGVPSAAAHLLSNHYNETRREYYLQLDESTKIPDGEFLFIKYALNGFIEGLKGQLALIKQQQLNVTWESYIHDLFKDKDSPANERRRHLVLDISNENEPIKGSKIKELTPRIATAYSKKTPRTIIRDLRILLKLDLIEIKKDAGIKAKKERILAFLPRRISN
jgi:Fic family protein